MMAMLRFLYDLPYAEGIADWYDGRALLQHAQVYVVAEKYEVENLKPLVHANIRKLLEYDGDKIDFVDAMETIIENTPESDTLARQLMVDHFVGDLASLNDEAKFMALLKGRQTWELPSLPLRWPPRRRTKNSRRSM